MAHLIAITFDGLAEAQSARIEFSRMSREHLVELEDSVVVYQDPKGRVRLDQTVNLAATGAVHGGFWGLLLGFLLSIPTGGALLPIVTAVFGAGFGALGGKLSDYGVDDEMMRQLGKSLGEGKAMLFILAREMTVDKVFAHLERFKGRVVKTSLPLELERKLQEVLQQADKLAA